MMALTGGDPKRRLILATGVTYEFQINNLGNDAGAQ
jgi:hypothetical protein